MQWLSDFYANLKAFFKYSETIFVARIQALAGLVTVVVGAVDWSPVFSLLGVDTGFSWKQTVWTGIGLFFKGLMDEILRRRNSNL